MQAAIHTQYGAPDVLTVDTVPAPEPAPGQIRVAVAASAVTQGDAWIRGGDFPGVGWLPGRLMMGLFRPQRHLRLEPGPGLLGHGRRGLLLGRGARAGHERMVRVLPDLPPLPVTVWLVAHRELRSSARVRVVYDALAEALRAQVI